MILKLVFFSFYSRNIIVHIKWNEINRKIDKHIPNMAGNILDTNMTSGM